MIFARIAGLNSSNWAFERSMGRRMSNLPSGLVEVGTQSHSRKRTWVSILSSPLKSSNASKAARETWKRCFDQ